MDRVDCCRSRYALWSVLLVLSGVGIYIGATPIASSLSKLLPLAFTVRSAGTYYPSFGAATGFAFHLKVLGGLFVIAPWGAFAVQFVSQRFNRCWIIAVLLMLCVFSYLLSVYISYPPPLTLSNFRILWVDINYFEKFKYLYYLRRWVPLLMNDYPHLQPGLYTVANVLLMYLIGKSLYSSKGLAIGAGVAYSVSGIMIAFYAPAESVLLAVLVLLFALWCNVKRFNWICGIALFIATLSRFQFASLIGVFLFAELVVFWPAAEHGLTRKMLGAIHSVLRSRFVITNVASFTVLFGAWHSWLYFSGRHFLDPSSSYCYPMKTHLATGIPVSGYVLEKFDGAWLGHFLWIFPLVLTFANALIPFVFRKLSCVQKRVYIISTAFLAGNIFLLCSINTGYFNVRYLAFFFPYFLLSGLLAADVLSSCARIPGFAKIAITIIMVLSPACSYAPSFMIRDMLMEMPIVQLYKDRLELRKIDSPKGVFTDAMDRNNGYALSYLLNVQRVAKVEPGDPLEVGAIFAGSRKGGLYYSGEELGGNDQVVVKRVSGISPEAPARVVLKVNKKTREVAVRFVPETKSSSVKYSWYVQRKDAEKYRTLDDLVTKYSQASSANFRLPAPGVYRLKYFILDDEKGKSSGFTREIKITK